ncbi:hypothetical protein ARMSODRAFT_1017257 [Armillaria solidipes]|uniref:Mid2 domain-containing protein n=1 Tax=Armillaria solidipes TaxID=1076256 RepID=A0A2H3C5F6_9AGAR|nr:hypothetical protein ARMSODRAFT_1017257 [Armillaria solidipes]
MKRLSFVSFFLYSSLSWALTNLTIDDTSSMINYKGTWDSSSSHTSSLDYGGSHTLSSQSSASATFTFTGVAVYFLSPLWPYWVNSTITIDGGDETTLNLTDPVASTTDSGGSESSPYGVRWSQTGLSNSSHEVVVSMASSGQWVVVDGFIYTVDNGSETVTSSTVSSSASASATATGTNGGGGSGTNVLGIALGASLGAVTLLTAIGIFFFCYRRRRNASNSTLDKPWHDAGAGPFSPTLSPPAMSQDFRYSHVSNNSFSGLPSSLPATAASSTFPLLAAANSNYRGHAGSGSASSAVASSSHPLMVSNPGHEDTPFNPYHESLYASSTGDVNFAGLGTGMATEPVASGSTMSTSSLPSKRYADEKRAQSKVIAETLPPPAYSEN